MHRDLAILPDQFSTLGALLKYLRRRVGLTQRELAIAVGYSDPQISRSSGTSGHRTRPRSLLNSSRPSSLSVNQRAVSKRWGQ